MSTERQNGRQRPSSLPLQRPVRRTCLKCKQAPADRPGTPNFPNNYPGKGRNLRKDDTPTISSVSPFVSCFNVARIQTSLRITNTSDLVGMNLIDMLATVDGPDSPTSTTASRISTSKQWVLIRTRQPQQECLTCSLTVIRSIRHNIRLHFVSPFLPRCTWILHTPSPGYRNPGMPPALPRYPHPD